MNPFPKLMLFSVFKFTDYLSLRSAYLSITTFYKVIITPSELFE